MATLFWAKINTPIFTIGRRRDLINSYIDIGKIIDLPIATVQSNPIGNLSEKSLRNLLNAMNDEK